MKKTWIILVAVIVLVGAIFVAKYNSFVAKNETVNKDWAQVENVLQRRADLIPNLVETVKGYAAHENETLTEVTKARAAVGNAQTIPEQMTANNQLTAALSKLMVVVERYPDLKANQNFLALQDELAGTENRIAVERKRYNETVNDYNRFAKSLVNRMLSGIFGFPLERDYFKADEGAKTAPKVQFTK